MPKELLEIKNFTLGVQTTPSETDISHEAASYSLNVDPIAQDGKLQAIPDDVAKKTTFGTNIKRIETIKDGDTGLRTIIAYQGDGSGTDGKILYANDIENASTPALSGSALISDIDATAADNENIDMEISNKELHIALGSSNDPKWVGKIDHTQFGSTYSTTNGFYGTDAELKSPSQFKSCYKWIWRTESGTNYVYGIEYKGNRVYKFKEDTAGAAYSFVSASNTRFESTQGICARHATGTNETATTATLWIFDANAGTSGILYAYDPVNDEVSKTFPISHDWTNDTDHTYISDIIEMETNLSADDARLIYFSKHYNNEYPIIHKDYYSGNTGELDSNYGGVIEAEGGFGVGILYCTDQASHQASTDIASKTITLFKNTPLLFPPIGLDDLVCTGMPYYVGGGSGYRGWTYMEPYTDIQSSDYSKKFLGGIVGVVGEGDNAVATNATYGNADDSRYLDEYLGNCTMGGGDWSSAASDYHNCRLINSILTLCPVLADASQNGHEGYNGTEFGINATSGEVAFMTNIMQKNMCIDPTNKLVFFTSRSAPGVNAENSVLSAVRYQVLDGVDDVSDYYGASFQDAHSSSVLSNMTKLHDETTDTTYGTYYGDVVCDPALKVVIVCKGHGGVELYPYTGTTSFTLGTVSARTCTNLFNDADIRVDRILIDTENQIGVLIGNKFQRTDEWGSGGSKYVFFNYNATSISEITATRTAITHSFIVSAHLDSDSKKFGFQLIGTNSNSALSDGYSIGLVSYDPVGAKGSYSDAVITQDIQFYKDPVEDANSRIPIDIYVDGTNKIIHTTERHTQGRAYGGTTSDLRKAVTSTDGSPVHIYSEEVNLAKNINAPFNGTDGDQDLTSGAGAGEYVSAAGNTEINTFSIAGNSVGEHVQSVTVNETNREDLAHGQITVSSDGKYMFLGGTADCRSIQFIKRNVNNMAESSGATSKGVLTHSQYHFHGAASFEASGSLMGQVLLDENYHILFTQDVNNDTIKMYMYCTDDDYRITTPKANLAAIRGQVSVSSGASYKGLALLWKTAHPLGAPIGLNQNGTGAAAKWWMHGIHGAASDIGRGVAASSNYLDAVHSGTEASLRFGSWGDQTSRSAIYDADVIGITNITGPAGTIDSDADDINRHLAIFHKKSTTETYLSTIQSQNSFGPIMYSSLTPSAVNSSFSYVASVNRGEFNIPESMGALRWDSEDAIDDDSILYGALFSSETGTSLTAAFKVDAGSGAANPDNGGTYDPSSEEVVEGPTSVAFLNNFTVNSEGGTLKKDYKYFYKLSFIYDGYQESPLGDDLQIPTVYDSLQYTNNILNSNPVAITSDTVSISFDVNINTSLVNKRVTAVRVYRAENSDSDSFNPEGFYRMIKEQSLDDSWISSKISGSKPTFTTNKAITVYDNGASFQNFEANTGISEVIDTYNIKYKCNTQLNNTHFVGNCSTGLDANLLGSNYVVKSKPYNFDQFNVLTDVLALPDSINALHAFQGRIYAFCDNNTYKIEPNNLFIEDTWTGMGTFNQQSVYSSDYGMCWCDKNNIYLFDGRQVQTIGDTILKGDNMHSWQSDHATGINGSGGFTTVIEKPQVFWEPKRKAFMVLFTSDTDHRKIWAYSVTRKRWDLWDPGVASDNGDDLLIKDFTHGPNGEVYYVHQTNASTTSNLITFAGNTTRKPLSWHSKRLTMGMDTQVKLFKKVRLTGFDGVDENILNSDVSVSFLTAAGNPESGDEFSDGTTQSIYSLSGSAAKSEWLKVKIDAADNDNLQIDSIGVVYRRRPIR